MESGVFTCQSSFIEENNPSCQKLYLKERVHSSMITDKKNDTVGAKRKTMRLTRAQHLVCFSRYGICHKIASSVHSKALLNDGVTAALLSQKRHSSL